MLKEEQKSDSSDALDPSQKDYEQKFYDREFSGIAENNGSAEKEENSNLSLANAEKSSETGKNRNYSPQSAADLENSYYKNATEIGGLSKIKFSGIFENKKRTGGILGGFIAIIASIILGINTLGPLQFIHFSQLLQSFHLSDQEIDGNSRIKKLLIYAKTQDVNKTRLGLIAGKYSTKIDAKLSNNGWEIKSTSAGIFNGFTYDPNLEDKDGNKQPLSAEEMKAKLDAEGVKDVRIENNKVIVPPDSMKYWSNKSLIKQIYSGSNRDIGRITSAFDKRILIKRSGITLNPVTKLDQKINQSISDYIKDLRAKKLSGQLPVPDFTTKAQADPDSPNGSGDAEAAEAEKAINDAKSGKIKSVTSISFKTAGGIGIICAVKAISDGVDESKKLNAIVPLMQASSEVLGLGSKIQDGGDVNMKIINEYSKSLYGRTKDNKSSWSEASTLKYEQDSLADGTRLPDEFNPNPEQSTLNSFFSQIVGLDSVCNAVNSTLGSIAITLVTGGPLSKVLDLAIDQILQASGVFNTLIAYLSGEAANLADPQYAGGVYGEAASVGTRILANETSSSMGGRVLSDSEEVALRDVVKQDYIASNSSRSVLDKYFNPLAYDTPVAKMIDNINTGSASETIANIPSSIIGNISSMFSSKVSAADTIQSPSDVYYGISKVGFAAGSLDKPELENPYKNANKALEILQNNTYVDLLKTCNKVQVLGLPNGPLDFVSESGSSATPVFIDQEELPDECKNDDINFLIVRTAVFDTMKMQSFACIEFDDAESCAAIYPLGVTNTTMGENANLNSSDGWVWPMAKNLKAGPCWNVLVGGRYHAGIDINTDNISEDNPAIASHDGQVVNTGTDDAAGWYITIKATSDGIYYSYQHLNRIDVKEGDTVKAGDPVGLIGKTGNVSASSAGHLHFVMAKTNTLGAYSYTPQQTTVDPLNYLPKEAPNGYRCIE